METANHIDWVLIYSTNQEYKADLLTEILGEQGIPAQSMNKKDSLFNVGDIEIYVLKPNVIAAQYCIDQHPDL